MAKRLAVNIGRLYEGDYEALLDIYRERSAVLGRRVTVREDLHGAAEDVIASGLVRAIGPELELYIEGQSRPVTKGRVVLDED